MPDPCRGGVGSGGGKRSIFVHRAALDTRLVRLRRLAGSAPPNASVTEVANQVQGQLEQVLERLSAVLERVQQAE